MKKEIIAIHYFYLIIEKVKKLQEKEYHLN